MKSSYLAKLFFILTLYVFLLTFFFGYLLNIKIVNVIRIEFSDLSRYLNIRSEINYNLSGFNVKDGSLKYILLWTSPKHKPFLNMGKGQTAFIKQNCSYTNCFITSSRNFLGDLKKFHAVLFNGPDLKYYDDPSFLPWSRSPHQKYVFVSKLSADLYPICMDNYDGYFNWTWTYRLDSDAWWGYVIIKDSNDTVIGPKRDMHWMQLDNMKPVTKNLKKQLKTKSKLAAVFYSNCESRNKRETYVNALNKELGITGFEIDIFGKCGTVTCPNNNENLCDDMIKKDYFFILAFENSFSEDYVTDKLVNALQNYAVPIVFGGANYSRFMPEGIYIDAREYSIKELANKMLDLAFDFGMYAKYFRWTNHYSYHKRGAKFDFNYLCDFCALLNNESKMKEVSFYEKFRKWWDPPNRC